MPPRTFGAEPVELFDPACHRGRQGVTLVGAVAERGRNQNQRRDALRRQHGEPGSDQGAERMTDEYAARQVELVSKRLSAAA